MKQKILMLLAAVLLSSVNAFAQSEDSESLKGDVNGDGIVDVADIAAIIDIMANGGGTVEETAYYYYAGWTLPTVDNVNEIINEEYPAESGSTVMHKAGKKTSSPSTMDYTTNSLYNKNEKTNYYVLVPTGHAIYDIIGTNVTTQAFTSQGTITVGNIVHTIYKSNSTSRNIGAIIIRSTNEETAWYYYAGWTLPTADNVETIITETYPTSSSDSTQHAAGKKTTSKSSFSLATVNLYYSVAKTNYYVLVPTGHAIYDTVFGIQMGTDSFTSQGTITVGNQMHTIYKSVDTTRNIGSIEIR